MKRRILGMLLMLVAAAVTAVGEETDLEGNFLDFLIHLQIDRDTLTGIDPFLLSEPATTKVRTFKSRSGEDGEATLKRIADEVGFTVESSSSGAFYVTSSEVAATDLRLRLFIDRKYEQLSKDKNQDDALVQTAKILDAARKHAAQRKQQNATEKRVAKEGYAAIATEVKRANRGGDTKRLFDLGNKYVRRMDAWDKRLNQDYNAYDSSPAAIQIFAGIVASYRNVALAERAMLELLVYQVGSLNETMASIDPYLGAVYFTNRGRTIATREPGSFESQINPRVREELIALEKNVKAAGRSAQNRVKSSGDQVAKAADSWKAGEYSAAFHLASSALENGDFSRRTRAMHGLFQMRARGEATKAIRASLSKGGRTVNSLEPLAGIDVGFAEALSTLVGADVPQAPVPSTNPGRLGASYGLTVSDEGGHVSTFAIQARPKEPGGRREQIELHGVGDGVVDDHMIASIRDSLSYVSGNHVPGLFEKRQIVIFDRTVNIAYGGDSAGAALSVAALSRATGTPPEPDVCMTGAVRPFGDIRPIGGVLEKARAALDAKFKIMLVPTENAPDLERLEFEELCGAMQVLCSKTMPDFISVAMPSKDGETPPIRKSLSAYALAHQLRVAGYLRESLACANKAIDLFPGHASASMLSRTLTLAGVEPKPLPAAVTSYLTP